MTGWRPYARRFAVEIARKGVLEPGWREAFEEVPRHAFIDAYYDEQDQVRRPEEGDEAAWLERVYQDEPLTTQVAAVPGTDLRFATSSSTMPSLMARMLGLLQAAPGNRVLEIGTGTGYNAALLCHRLGADAVTSVDLDPTLVESARDRLGRLGFQPHLVAGDGADGVAERAPFSRIIATAAVPAIPAAWIAQLAEDGRIVADVRGEAAGGLVVLTRTAGGIAAGRFTGGPAHFMWLRRQVGNPLRDGGAVTFAPDLTVAGQDTTDLNPADLADDGLRYLLQTACDLTMIGPPPVAGPPATFLYATDGSWVQIGHTAGDSGRRTVTAGGPAELWSTVAATWRDWLQLGRPGLDRYWLTAGTDGANRLHVDVPGTGPSWPLR